MDKDWILVYSTTQEWKPEIISHIFDDNGIACVVVNKKDSSYLFGEIEIYVNGVDFNKAQELIKNFDN